MFTDLAIRKNRKHRDVAARVIRDKQKCSRAIERQIAGIFTKRRKLIQQSKLSVVRVNGKCAERAGLARFIHGIQIFSVGMYRDPRRVFGFGSNLDHRHFSGRRIKSKFVNAFAICFCGVSSDVSPVGLRGRWSDSAAYAEERKRSAQQYEKRRKTTQFIHGAE